MKARQAWGSMGCLIPGLTCRSAVEAGFHGICAGFIKAFKLCIMESSIAPRDIRRKSDVHERRQLTQ